MEDHCRFSLLTCALNLPLGNVLSDSFNSMGHQMSALSFMIKNNLSFYSNGVS